MRNTERLYLAVKGFTDVRAAEYEKYMNLANSLAAMKGSAYYVDRMEKARSEREQVVSAARDSAITTVNSVLQDMKRVNSGRKVTAPTEEQMRLLNAMKIREKVSYDELAAVANSLDGNGVALAALQDIAVAKGHLMAHFDDMANNVAISVGDNAVKMLAKACTAVFSGSGAERAALVVAKRYNRAGSVDDLPREAPYENEQDFYSRICSVPYETICSAVNGESEGENNNG